MPPPQQLTPDLLKRLERKTTFQAAVAELTAAVQDAGACHDVGPLVLRTHALLKARHSSVAAWKAGLELFQAVEASAATPAALKARLPGFISDARAFVAEGLEAGSEQPRQQTLGELLLGLPPPAPAQSHLSDAGLVLDHAPAMTAAAAAAFAGSEQQEQEEEEQGGAQQHEAAAAVGGGGGEQELSVLEVLRRLHEAASTADGEAADGSAEGGADGAELAGEGAAGGGGADGGGAPDTALPGSLEALQQELLHSNRAELEAMLISLVEQHTAGQAGGGSSRPAASKAAVARLPVVTLDSAAALESVGGPTAACPVCTEDLSANGDKVQRLPCKHVFHVNCLAPWLQQDNSCPVCRQELPTDDHKYESRKEREAQEAEDRRGAANALSHNEFMWI